jgi:P pilus assembly chaperone PapD
MHSTIGARRPARLLAALSALALAVPAWSAQVPASPPPAGPTLGGLLVAPTRLVFEGRRRGAELTLINTGNQPATYRISFVQMRLTERGAIEELPEGETGQFADRLVRYSPRQVVLDPGAPQTVRLQLRKPADLTPGEYRSHLVFRAVPPVPPSGAERPGSSGFQVRLTAVYGVAIPIIVRQGETSATATLSGLEVRPGAGGGPVLQFRINRTGNRSVYGNLTATFVPAAGRASVVGIMNGVAVYSPNPIRVVELPLRPPPGVALRQGRLRLAYVAAETPGDPREPLASAEIALP